MESHDPKAINHFKIITNELPHNMKLNSLYIFGLID